MYDTIIYHNADPDGIFSAAIGLMTNLDAECIGYNYGDDFPAIVDRCHGKSVLIVDVSPKNWQDMHRLCGVAKSVFWIDHHPTALAAMKENGIEEIPNFGYDFEHDKWGACKKVWEHIFPDAKWYPLPILVRCIAMYDAFRDYGTDYWDMYAYPMRFVTGQFKDPENAMYFMEKCNDLGFFEKQLEQGRAIAQYVEHENAALVANQKLCYPSTFRDGTREYRILLINRPLFADMFKSLDLSEYDFCVGFQNSADGWRVSLRGAGKDINLGQIAKQFGGGGHKDAAGFHVSTSGYLRDIIDF